MNLFIHITKEQNGYRTQIHQGNAVNGREFASNLAADARVEIRGRVYSLGELSQMLINYASDELAEAYDERGQLEIGRYLYSQTIGQLPEHEQKAVRRAGAVDIYLASDDEHITRLPWSLLYANDTFLATAGWSIALCAPHHELINCELPPSPRMLIVAPRATDLKETFAELHLDDLEAMLSPHDRLLTRDRNLRVVCTWAEFVPVLQEFEPHVLYFYGHGAGNAERSRLAFENEDNTRQMVPVADFAMALRNAPRPPVLVYVNCCAGDTAGSLGVGKQLAAKVPAVITNRTVAIINAAQCQGLAFWEDLLLRGAAPHQAVARLYSRTGDLGLSIADPRWMTPVFHRGYAVWRSNPPKAPGRLVHDPNWHLKIDRVTQFGTVATQTRQMLRERKPKSHAFVWYGREGEGIDIFHQRLAVELREDLHNTYLYEVRPAWPMELVNASRSFDDMLCEAFAVNTLDDVAARVRSEGGGVSGRNTLIYVRHEPVENPVIINPGSLKLYLEWWNSHFLTLLERHQYALMGVSFIVTRPEGFRQAVVDRDRLEELDLEHTVFRLLDEMERIARRDLMDFIRTHNIQLPLTRRQKVLDNIIEKTEGRYEQTIDELKNLVDLAWDMSADETDAEALTPAEKYDY